MQRMTIGGAFGAMFDFIRTSWMVILGSMLLTVLVAGGAAAALIGGNMQALASNDPAVALSVMGSLMLVVLIGVVFYQAGSFLSWRHGLTGGSEPVLSNLGWALGASALSLLAMMVIGLIVYLAIIVVVLVLVAILAFSGLMASNPFAPGADMAGASVGIIVGIVIAYLLAIIAFYWIYGRFSASGPVMAVRRTVNPITGLTESWRMTGPSQWVILGWLLLMALISFAVSVAVAMVFGVALAGAGAASGSPDAATGAGTIVMMLLIYIPSLILAVAMPAAIYRQVSDGDMQTGEIFT